jgi:hypothetical protein
MAKFEAGASSAAGSRFTRRELLRRSATVAADVRAGRPAQAERGRRSRAAEPDLKDIFGKWRRLGKI